MASSSQVLFHQLRGARGSTASWGGAVASPSGESHGKDAIGQESGSVGRAMGRTVLITGATGGLGPAVVAFGEAGWRVVAPGAARAPRSRAARRSWPTSRSPPPSPPRWSRQPATRTPRCARWCAPPAGSRQPAGGGDAGRDLRGAVRAQPADHLPDDPGRRSRGSSPRAAGRSCSSARARGSTRSRAPPGTAPIEGRIAHARGGRRPRAPRRRHPLQRRRARDIRHAGQPRGRDAGQRAARRDRAGHPASCAPTRRRRPARSCPSTRDEADRLVGELPRVRRSLRWR